LIASRSSVRLTGIGQYDVTATPLQMSMVSAAIAGGGKLVSPHMVAQITDSGGDVLEDYDAEADTEESGTARGRSADQRGDRGRQDRHRPARWEQQQDAVRLVHVVGESRRQGGRRRGRRGTVERGALRGQRQRVGRAGGQSCDAGGTGAVNLRRAKAV
jgi:membrane carboxypeptidase/penicillin-binding protein